MKPACPRCESPSLFLPTEYVFENVQDSIGDIREESLPHCISCGLKLLGVMPWLAADKREVLHSKWNSYIDARIREGWVLDKNWHPERFQCFWALHGIKEMRQAGIPYVTAFMSVEGKFVEYRQLVSESNPQGKSRKFVGSVTSTLITYLVGMEFGIDFLSLLGATTLLFGMLLGILMGSRIRK